MKNPLTRRMATTSAQYGIWMAQQMVPESPSYLTAETIVLRGPLDTQALSTTVNEVLHHARALHMRFEMDEEGLWQWPQTPGPVLEQHDFRAATDPEAAAQTWMQASLARVCDLTRDPLYRTALLQLADDHHLWYLQVHHIALDGYGYALICQTVAQRYSARVRGEVPPALPDWGLERLIQAEQDYKAQGRFARDQAFWQRHLQQAPALATISEVAEFSDEVRRLPTRLDAQDIEPLQQAAQRCQQDWGSWMLAAIGLWLARHSRQHHLTFGLPVMNRLGTPALGVPCMAMNIVPMSLHVHPQASMQALSLQMAERMRAIRPHLYYRYGWIRGDLGLLEVGKHLFNQAVNLMPFDRHAPWEGLDSRMQAISAGPVKDLNISVSVLQQQWSLLLEANPHAYDAQRLQTLQQDLLQFLRALAAHPPTEPLAPLLPDLPARSVLQGPTLAAPPRPVLEQLQQAAQAHPDKTAIEFNTETLSYAQLLHAVQKQAARLSSRGVQAQDRVVILLPRGLQALVSLWATLWRGACYVPLDPQSPPARLQAVLADAAPRCVVTLRAWATKVAFDPALNVLCLDDPTPNTGSTSIEPPHTWQPSQPAYLLYTSGSTGNPKGVLVSHGALAHFVASAGQLYAMSAADRVLQFAPLHFDASVEEIFLALCHGATLVLRNDAVLDSVSRFVGFVGRARISVLDLPTAYWHELVHGLEPASATALAGLRLTIIGGEAALSERARRWRELLPQAVLLNSYGPTEASVIATTAALSGPHAVWDGQAAVPIGLPRPGVMAVVVDEQLYPVAQGRVGELLLCGEALALGYLHRDEATAQRFVPLRTLAGTPRAYRTGDRVCWQDGQLRFMGRFDDEIKISGLRIDPAEIENALLTHPMVREAGVLAVPRAHAGLTLAAFVVSEQPVSIETLRTALADRLPAPAIPDQWQFLEKLPRNVNGKIDRKALLAQLPSAISDRALELTPLERQVMAVWAEVLGTAPADVHANFFDLGGKSLQAIQVSVRLSRQLQREVPVSALFHHATVQTLAKALSAPVAHRPPAALESQAFAPLLTLQEGRQPALFCIHPAEGLSWCYLALTRHLPGQAVYGLQACGDEEALPASFEVMVDSYVARVRQQQAHGPYRLLGWSLGGALAQAIAVQLRAQGETVDLLAVMDSYPAESFAAWREPTLMDALITVLSVNGELEAQNPEAIYERLLRANSPLAPLGREALERWGRRALHGMRLFRASHTQRYEGDLLLFHARERDAQTPVPAHWGDYVGGRLETVELDCNHFGMSDPAPLAVIGQTLAKRLARQEGPTQEQEHQTV